MARRRYDVQMSFILDIEPEYDADLEGEVVTTRLWQWRDRIARELMNTFQTILAAEDKVQILSLVGRPQVSVVDQAAWDRLLEEERVERLKSEAH